MNVSDLGEFGLIERLTGVFETHYRPSRVPDAGHRLLLGIGDDAAVWEAPAGRTVFTCDAMVAGSHFDLSYSRPEDVGWRAMVSCQSDVAAMGFRPAYSTVTLGLTGAEPVEQVDGLYEGMAEACSRFDGRVVGGDVVRSKTMFVSVAMTGADPSADGGPPVRPMTRSGAKAGDVVAVAGMLGGSAGGLRLLMRGDHSQGPDTTALVHAHRRPEPRVEAGVWLAANGVACAVDVSDGLIDDLGRVCGASGVAASVRLAELPVEPALKTMFPDEWPDLALGGGEGYQLLFTASADVVVEAKAVDASITAIGEIVAGDPKVTILAEDGSPIKTTASGFDHFGER